MNMHKTVKILSVSAVLIAGQLAFAFSVSGRSEQAAALDKSLRAASHRAKQAQELNISTVRTTWERCDIYTSRSRGNGKRVRVLDPRSCETVITTCGAVVSDEKVYTSAGCFYADKKEDQHLAVKESRLFEADGSSSLLGRLLGKVNDLVVFAK